MTSRDHEKVHGFPSSIVPTMEEMVVMDSIPEDSASSTESKEQEVDHDKPLQPQKGGIQENTSSAVSKNQDVGANGDAGASVRRDPSNTQLPKPGRSFKERPASSTQAEARVGDGELYGAPADASRDPKTDDQPPHAVSGKNDATEVEEKAVPARAEIRKHLSTKFNSKIWTLPTPAPEVDPHGFEDPISDEFWKKTWTACAVHNVGIQPETSVRCR